MGDNAFAGMSLGYDSKNVFKYRDENMCSKWKAVEKIVGPCKVKIYGNPYGNVVVTGTTNEVLAEINGGNALYVHYIAANSPTYGQSFSGSALPFTNEHIAFSDTNNKGVAEIKGGQFSFNIKWPNSYRKDMSKVLVGPQVKIQFCSKNGPISGVYEVELSNPVPFRNVDFPPIRNFKDGSLFYCGTPNLPIRSQWVRLEQSAFPCGNYYPYGSYWGMAVPQ